MFPRASIIPVLALALTSRAFAEPGHDFFESKVRPLLVERCYECHSEGKKIKGGLRLDTRAGWAEGGDAGPAIVPGKPEESLVIEAVRYRDKDLAMPPKKKLAAAEIAILEEWVRLGAPDPRVGGALAKKQTGLSLEEGRKFWAYVPPRSVPAPTVKDTAWPRTDIDRFILAKLEEKHLKPAPDAAPEALVRRLYFNLVGLPPTPEQVAAFAQAATANRQAAVERLTDELLASPHFGEKWGRHWLDVARFAESSGGGRTLLFKDAWRFRDYVIEAFNEDRPFDQFLREQIAGDLLPTNNNDQRRRQLTATAFLALGPTNYEEQDKQQLRFDVIDEQLDTIGKAVLGQTIGCARCHDHKFDPIPQRDYYAMAGIFASTRTLFNYTDNVARWIATPLPLEGEEEAAVAAHEGLVMANKEALAAAKKELATARKTQRSGLAEKQKGKAIPVAELPGVVIDDADAKVIGEWKESQHTPQFIGAGYRHDLNADKGRKTLTFMPKLPASGEYEVRLAYSAQAGRAARVPVHVFHANGEDTVHVDQAQEPPIDGRFVSLGKFRFEQDGAGYVLVSNEGTGGYVTADAVQFLGSDDAENVALVNQPAVAGPDAGATLQARVKELEAELKTLSESGPRRPAAMTVRDDEKAADTQIRVRGLVHQRGPEVPRGFLRVASPAEPPPFTAQQSGRRELADWLASPQNPLTARVFVNRAWHWLFGAGLVRTVDNFGTTGEAPSHPELLDALALRFVEQGWSVKRLIREIVLSRSWQLAAAKPGATDPDNRLFSHALRRRLEAEQIRDAILAASGELRLEVGGPNIAGAGEINANDTGAQNIEYKYQFADTRRSVYAPAFRNKRLELFEVFDFGDINATLGKRHTSTVATQALFLLNHPFVLAQSQLAAERALASTASDEARLERAFRRVLGRPPGDRERAASLRFVAAANDGRRAEAWSQLYQTLFASLDFRYLD